MAIKFVDELPKSKRASGRTVFTDEVIATLKDHVGMWAIIEATSSTASKFANENDGFEYATRSTGKTKKNKKGKDIPETAVYVRFNPSGKK